jgi:CRP/FNR family transcriptional regulator, cyclic AMP receptor protein
MTMLSTHFASFTHYFTNLSLIDMLGFAAAILAILAASKKAIIPLRIAAIASSLAFAIYYFFESQWVSLCVHGVTALCNIVRLQQMIELTRQTKAITTSDLPLETLKPFMKKTQFEPGAALFRKGTISDAAYYIISGEVQLPEIQVKLGPGNFVGEMGLFSENQTRTFTIVALTNVVALKISYHDLQELCLQNPSFGLSLFKLITRRQVANQLAQAKG